MIAKIAGTVLYFIGWRVWERRVEKDLPVYSDDVGVVSNAGAEQEKDSVTCNNDNNMNQFSENSNNNTKETVVSDGVVVDVVSTVSSNADVTTSCPDVTL